MAKPFKLPDLGEGIHEGEVLAVLVTVGQEVSEGDIILEVETDKAAVEIPSPYTGQIQEVFVKSGDVVNVGDVMLIFSNGDEAGAETHVDQPEEKPDAPVRCRLHRPRGGWRASWALIFIWYHPAARPVW
jgi:pyruvate dehydrogenase E2 component (dihydrolipoamide acetyltransferase)